MAGAVDGPRRFTARDGLVLLGLLALTLAVGQLGRIPSAANQDWYDTLDQLAIQPPGWAFPVAWTLLYLLMAVAMWLVWRAAVQAGGWQRARGATALFGAQLLVNLAWPYVFFGERAVLGGFLTIALLFVLVALTARAFARHSRLAAWLLAPYLAWLLYAGALNGGIVLLN
jgi:tryptophan-rich sensory protein